jgi:type III secretion protein J
MKFLLNLLHKFKIYYRNLLIIIFSSLILIACSSSQSIVVKNVDQDSANSIMLLLAQNHINVNNSVNKDGSINIAVASDKILQALTILKNNGLPTQKYTNMGEVFKKDGLISSPLEEHNRDLYATNQEIAKMINMIDGVLDADVKVSIPLPNDKLWDTEVPKPSAAVVIKYKQGSRIDLRINKIKTIVARAVAGLSPDMVEVVAFPQKDF